MAGYARHRVVAGHRVVGKVWLALAPMLNHWWWQVRRYVSSRAITTSLMRGRSRVEIGFDFLDHVLVVRPPDGGEQRVERAPRSVANFYAATTAAFA